MTDGRMLRPFHERFDIEVGIEEARQRFINRASMLVFNRFATEYVGSDFPEYFGSRVTKHVAYSLGDSYHGGLNEHVKHDFYRCLQVLEALYQFLEGVQANLEEKLSHNIDFLIDTSEIDLGIRWEPPVFTRAGAPLLDKHLVNEPLRWLSEPKYESVGKPFEKGLSHYLEAQNRPDRLADVITDMYEAVEALAKIVTGRPNKDLSANTEMFISKLKVSNHYKTLLKDYIAYGNEYRHAEVEAKPRPPLSEPEVESFIYLTGLFIRLAIRTT